MIACYLDYIKKVKSSISNGVRPGFLELQLVGH